MNNIIIGQAIVCVALIIMIICQKVRADKDCEVLLDALEEEQLLRSVERAVTNIMIQNRDKNIEMLKKCVEEAMRVKEAAADE